MPIETRADLSPVFQSIVGVAIFDGVLDGGNPIGIDQEA